VTMAAGMATAGLKSRWWRSYRHLPGNAAFDQLISRMWASKAAGHFRLDRAGNRWRRWPHPPGSSNDISYSARRPQLHG